MLSYSVCEGAGSSPRTSDDEVIAAAGVPGTGYGTGNLPWPCAGGAQ